MTTVYFVRHCSVNYTRNLEQDLVVSLSPQGLLQANELAKNWESEVDKIYSSPLPRAKETITPLSLKLNKLISVIDDFRELDYKGNAQEFHKQILKQIDFKFEGGETISQANNRFEQTVIKVCQVPIFRDTDSENFCLNNTGGILREV